MQVKGGRVDVTVPQELCQDRKVGPGQERQGGEGVPEAVGRRLLCELHDFPQSLDAALDRADRDTGPARGDDEGPFSGKSVLGPLLDPVEEE